MMRQCDKTDQQIIEEMRASKKEGEKNRCLIQLLQYGFCWEAL